MEECSSVVITVISGVLVYLIGEVLNEVWLKPLQQYKELKQKIASDIIFYGDCSFNGKADTYTESFRQKGKEAEQKYRMDAAELAGFAETISWIRVGIPSKKKLNEASKALIGMSNVLFRKESTRFLTDYSEEVRTKLKLTGSLGKRSKK